MSISPTDKAKLSISPTDKAKLSISPTLFPAVKLQEWLHRFYIGVEVLKKRGYEPTPANTREGLFNLTRSLVLDRPAIALVTDAVINGFSYAVPVRIYHPDPDLSLPALIYYHGGGHMAGSISIYDPICRKMALATKHIVVSVEYRLAPEFPYPAGVKDAFHVAKNIWSTLDAQHLNYIRSLSIAGDSAGGALCATVSHMAQYDEEIKIAKQVLIYPSLDYTISLPSVNENGSGYFLEKEKIKCYFDHYFQDGESSSSKRKSASPIFMKITPRMPDTLVITAQFCPLRDEGMAYAERLRKRGIYTEHLHFDNMIHAFLNMESLVPDACSLVYGTTGKFLNQDAS